MHAAVDRGTVSWMKDFIPSNAHGLPPRPGGEPPPRLPPRSDDGETPTGPRYEPSEHRFSAELGEGRRATLPAEFAEGRGMAPEDLTFELRQHTIAEVCRSFRLATHGGGVNFAELEVQLVRAGLRKIGNRDRVDLSDADFDSWFADIGPQGFKYVDELVSVLNRTLPGASTLYQASYRPQRAQRRHQYRLPVLGLAPKKWAARVGVEGAKWVATEKGDARWTINGADAPLDAQERLGRDLAFVMTEISVAQESSVADLAADPDDIYACRMLCTMLSIIEIGGRALGESAEDMEYKLAWLEDIGERHRTLVTGTYAKLNEVDRTALSRFCDAAEPLD